MVSKKNKCTKRRSSSSTSWKHALIFEKNLSVAMAPTKSYKKVLWSRGTHPPKPKRQKYSEETLQAALQAVANGMSQRKVTDEFGIPHSTLSDKLLGKSVAAVVRGGKEVVLGEKVEKR